MPGDDAIADNVISGGLKRSPPYHSDYGQKTYGELKQLSAANPPDRKARQMKKLIEQAERLRSKLRRRRR